MNKLNEKYKYNEEEAKQYSWYERNKEQGFQYGFIRCTTILSNIKSK